MQEWYQCVKENADKNNLDPNLCAALAAGESGIGRKEIRCCWLGYGQYHGPYNLCRGAFKYGDITDWRENTRIGIMLLANKLKKYGSLHAALRHYNTGDKGKKFESYVNNIKRLQRQYKERGIFG